MNINPMEIMQRVNQLKSQGGDPNQMIQQMMNSGKVTQAQYDQAVRQAQQIMQMLTPGGRR
jgi:hypothetical protein